MKAPSHDGYHVTFYQSQWEIVSSTVTSLISEIFMQLNKVRQLNETLIFIIPKIDNPSTLRQFCRIRLCNVSYKIVTMILASRLRSLMSKLVAPMHSSFVPGRYS